MTRTPLSQRVLPGYSRGEEIANMITHILAAAIGIVVLILSIIISVSHNNIWGVVTGSIYGGLYIVMYSISSTYHGLKPGLGKKVMQILDHCVIYLMIAGTYTPILLSGIRPVYPVLAWVIFGIEWALVAFAVVFTAIDHIKYRKLSMICYIGMGWCIIVAFKPTLEVLGRMGMFWILAGGIAYTIGAFLYKVGGKKRIFHTVFHLFVVAASIMQAIGILFYVL